MNTNYSYNHYQQERQRKAEGRRNAPQKCPYCGTPINQNLSEWDRIKTSCGSDKCRKAASRASIAERKRQARTDARVRVLAYAETQLDQQQKQVLVEMCDALMEYSSDEGHLLAEAIVQIIEAKRCKHDRIEVLERNAAIWKRKAQASEQQLTARVKELEAELELFNSLEATIHGFATRQQQLQPDPEESLPLSSLPTTDGQHDFATARTSVTLPPVGSESYEDEDEENDTDEDEGDE